MLDIVKSVNSTLWLALILLLSGTGIYYTFRLRFIQIRGFGKSFASVFGNIKLKGDTAGNDGMSSFQSLATAIAAQVGTGNLAGAATAIVSGGPGAVFWMWVSAFFGMATIYAEATLAQQYKTTVDGQVTGGPAYYIRAAFKGRCGKLLAGSFSILIVLALGFMGNIVQANSISAAFTTAFGIPPIIIGVSVAVMSFCIFRGSVKSIASVVEKVVPFMALTYICISATILLININNLLPAFAMIFTGAFNPEAVVGGAIGITVKEAARYGVARGLFSNEAGMGSTPHAHAIAKVKHPCDQGLTAIMGVFIATFVITSSTAIVILVSGAYDGATSGIALTQNAFVSAFGPAGPVIIAVCLFFFAFSTIIGWYFFGEVNIKYLFGKKAVPAYALMVCALIVVGSLLEVEMVWELADLFNGFMVIPNLIGLLALSGLVIRLSREHEAVNNQPLDNDNCA